MQYWENVKNIAREHVDKLLVLNVVLIIAVIVLAYLYNKSRSTNTTVTAAKTEGVKVSTDDNKLDSVLKSL